MRTETVRAKVSHNTKIGAEHILDRLGLSMSEAINLMLVQLNLQQALPFDIAIPKSPKPETLRAMKQAEEKDKLNTYKNPKQLFNKLGMNVNAKDPDHH